MQTPAVLDLYADRRVPFFRQLVFVGFNFGGTFEAADLHIRTNPDTEGAPLIALGAVNDPNVQGITMFYAGNTTTLGEHVAAGVLDEVPVGYDASEAVPLSIMTIRILKPALASLPYPTERGEDGMFFYDFIWNSQFVEEQVYLRGRFIVRAGVTIRA